MTWSNKAPCLPGQPSTAVHLACCQKALLLSLPDDWRPDVKDFEPPSLRRLAADVTDPFRRWPGLRTLTSGHGICGMRLQSSLTIT